MIRVISMAKWKEKLDNEQKEAMGFFLASMSNVIDMEYDEDFFDQKDWFLKRTWTKQQEDLYREWLINVLHKQDKQRYAKVLSGRRRKLKKWEIENLVNWLLLNYGWKYADD